MNKKNSRPADIYVEPLDRHTEVAIRREIVDSGNFDFDQRQIPLKINDTPKDVIHVTREFLEKMRSRKSQVELHYNVYTLSRNGRFLNLPRESFENKGDSKTKREKTRLNGNITVMLMRRQKSRAMNIR